MDIYYLTFPRNHGAVVYEFINIGETHDGDYCGTSNSYYRYSDSDDLLLDQMRHF